MVKKMYFCFNFNIFFVEAEIDSAAELIDFLRFNCHYTKSLMRHQPISVRPEETLNRLRLRSLEGFIASVTPFNFTAIAGNLAYAPAIMVRTAQEMRFLFFD
jgi:1-pyrroline-5-carboxylate dehydrogenase